MRGSIFWSRWLQAPLYLGLIIAQAVYVYHFCIELVHLFGIQAGGTACMTVYSGNKGNNFYQETINKNNQANKQVNNKSESSPELPKNSVCRPKSKSSGGKVIEIEAEVKVMLSVLTLIDVVMIANLLVMVIIGGYETFVSRLRIGGHPDQPEWLSQVNAGMLKVKLAMALIGISSIHLLKTFILAPHIADSTIMWQVIIHMAFLLSALAMAYTDRLMHPAHEQKTSA